MREVASGFTIGAGFSAVDRTDTAPSQRRAGESVQIRLPASPRVRLEGCGGGRIQGGKRRAHLVADLECRLADCGAEPGQNFRGIGFQRPDGRLEHAVSQAAPAGVGDTDAAAVGCRQQHGQAVGRHDRQDRPSAERDSCIRRTCIATIPVLHAAAVDLLEPGRLGRQVERGREARPVRCDCRSVIADMSREIEARVCALTDSAVAGRLPAPNTLRRGPVGGIAGRARRHRAASRSQRSTPRRRSISAGNGLSNCSMRPADGCASSSRYACKAWREKLCITLRSSSVG